MLCPGQSLATFTAARIRCVAVVSSERQGGLQRSDYLVPGRLPIRAPSVGPGLAEYAGAPAGMRVFGIQLDRPLDQAQRFRIVRSCCCGGAASCRQLARRPPCWPSLMDRALAGGGFNPTGRVEAIADVTSSWMAKIRRAGGHSARPHMPSVSASISCTVTRTRLPALRTLPSTTYWTPSSRATCCTFTALPLYLNEELRR